jgi:hypothetical protein
MSLHGIAYNVTISSQASTIRYYPQREGLMRDGWNSTYSGSTDFQKGSAGIGFAARRTVYNGARMEMDWFGTAAYLYGSAPAGSYHLSVDGGNPTVSEEDITFGLLGKFEGLDYKNHTLLLEVVNGSSPVQFRGATLTLQIGVEGWVALVMMKWMMGMLWLAFQDDTIKHDVPSL